MLRGALSRRTLRNSCVVWEGQANTRQLHRNFDDLIRFLMGIMAFLMALCFRLERVLCRHFHSVLNRATLPRLKSKQL